MALVYRVYCDGFSPKSPCPREEYLTSRSMVDLTNRAVQGGWRLGRKSRDHCPACWKLVQRRIQEIADGRDYSKRG